MIGSLGCIPCGPDLGLAPFALSDVAINENETAVWHGIAANFDHTTIWSNALCLLLFRIFEAALEFYFDVILPKFSSFREDAEVIGIARALRQDRTGEVQHFLKIAIPSG